MEGRTEEGVEEGGGRKEGGRKETRKTGRRREREQEGEEGGGGGGGRRATGSRQSGRQERTAPRGRPLLMSQVVLEFSFRVSSVKMSLVTSWTSVSSLGLCLSK